MLLNPIEKNMIVQTSIELQPTCNYVSASNDCSFLDRLSIPENSSGIKLPGVYGSLSPDSVNIKDDRVYSVNTVFLNNTEKNSIEKLAEAKDVESSIDADMQNYIDSLDTSSLTSQEAAEANIIFAGFRAKIKKDNFNLRGIKKTGGKSNFSIERVENKFIIDNPSYLKRRSLMNIYSFYRENMSYENYYDLHWGFKNYSSLNFFNIYDDINENFRNDITHKNCLIYPNIYLNGKSSYPTNTDEYSFSFYINPRRTVNSSFHYNPGCIINIPGIASIYIVKGSNTNEKNEVSSFRIFCELGDDTYDSLNNNLSNFNIDNTNSQTNSFSFLSLDNLLNLNNWHNVCISYKRNNIGTNLSCDVSLYVDGLFVEEFIFSSNISHVNQSSYITIGNKISLTSQQTSDFVLHSFSKDDAILDDNAGPYVNKHILLGDDINSVLNTGSDSNITYSFLNSLNTSNSDYISEETSLALNAEIVDLRIYNDYFDEEKAKNIAQFGISNINLEIQDFNLCFYLPVYYRSQNVKKKGLVNLSAPYQKTVRSDFGGGIAGSGSITGTVGDYLNGIYYNENNEEIDESVIAHEDDFRVKTSNISYNFPVNPFFLNFTGGTEVSVEHFLREFVKNTQPNIVVGGKIKEDRYQDCFLGKSSTIVSDMTFNDLAKKGKTPFSLYEKIVKSLNANDLANMPIDYQNNNISYRNYMILPCDNGLQRQYYNNNVFRYTNSEDLGSHTNHLKEVDFSFVSLEYINKDFSLRNSVNKRNLIISDNIDNQGQVIEEENRNLYAFDNRILTLMSLQNTSLRPLFYEQCDKLKNISLSNFHNLEYSSFISEENLLQVHKNSVFRNRGFYSLQSNETEDLLSRNGFYKTASNPAQRSYYSSYDYTVSNTQIYDTKQIEENSVIGYKKMLLPLSQLDNDFNENCSVIFGISTQIFNKKIKNESFEIKDVDLSMSSGLKITFKDSRLGSIYRSDANTTHAMWNTSGNILYNEGFLTLMHPSMFSFGKTNFEVNFKSHTNLNVFELNLPSHSGETNRSSNLSYQDGIKLDESAFNTDEDFVYITDIDLHDENLNVVASVKLSQPFAKKDSDNVLFRVKMDF